MYSAFLALLVVSIGLSTYAAARRAGVWSWKLFGLAITGMLAITAVSTGTGLWLASKLGPEHAGLITLVIVALIVAGLVVLCVWINRLYQRSRAVRPNP